jgi:hypothetical protein
VQRQNRLCLQTAKVFDKDQLDVSPDDINQYFETLSVQIRSISSIFVWNADETRVGCPEKRFPPEVIVAISRKPGTLAIPEVRDNEQLTLLTPISAFGDSTHLLYISKLKTFEKMLPAAQRLYSGDDHVIRSAPKTFIMEILFTDWLQNIFLPRISEFQTKFTHDGLILLVFDGHSAHMTVRVITLCAARKIILIRLGPHSSHLAQPLEL